MNGITMTLISEIARRKPILPTFIMAKTLEIKP